MAAEGYPSDAELVAGLGRGESEAVGAFIERYGPPIRARLRRFRMGDDDLDDRSVRVVQKVIRRITGSQPVTNLRAYVAKAATNEGIDWARKQRLQPKLEDGVDLSRLPADRVHIDAIRTDQLGDVEYFPRNPDAARVLEEALASLEPWERVLLILHEKGESYADIALILKDERTPVKEATWRKRHERAHEKLLDACRRLAAGKPDVMRALQEGRGLLRTDDSPSD
jgi:RNA polymerase sigma factor (sigma-70 family)